MICAIVGSMAFIGVRRQKRNSASLFDQRKLGAEARRGLSQSSNFSMSAENEAIELKNMQQEEVTSLLVTYPVGDDSLEII